MVRSPRSPGMAPSPPASPKKRRATTVAAVAALLVCVLLLFLGLASFFFLEADSTTTTSVTGPWRRTGTARSPSSLRRPHSALSTARPNASSSSTRRNDGGAGESSPRGVVTGGTRQNVSASGPPAALVGAHPAALSLPSSSRREGGLSKGAKATNNRSRGGGRGGGDDGADVAGAGATASAATSDTALSPPPPTQHREEVPASFFLHGQMPRWGVGGSNEEEGIQVAPMLDFIHGIAREDRSIRPYGDAIVYVVRGGGGGTDAHGIMGGGVWASEMIRRRIANNPAQRQVLPRFQDVEPALARAWNILLSSARRNNDDDDDDPVARGRWSALFRVAEVGGGAGFPIILWNADSRGCNLNNFRRNQSVPIFTTCAAVRCTYAFPVPNYMTVRDSLPDSKFWDVRFRRQSEETPWHKKRNQVVWRGTLTGPAPRIRLGTFAAVYRNHSLLDIGVVRLPRKIVVPDNVQQQLLMKPPMPSASFSHYKAILDIDGNSWSSRFGELLCRNSVVLKVEPEYVDYFYKYLTPWTHYIPIREDLSDLLEAVEWVMDASNEGRVLKIVGAANDWCRTHMTHEAVAHDMLDVLNAYVLLLDRDDPDWWSRWGRNITSLLHPKSTLDMHRLKITL